MTATAKKIEDWRKAVGALILVHRKIGELDREGLWANELPTVAAKPEQITETEQALGCRLNPRYREFLLAANGWRAFYQWVDLFGTRELLGEPMQRAAVRIAVLQKAGVLPAALRVPRDVMPVAMTRSGEGADQPDLFVLLAAGDAAGSVLWISDEEVDRFESFDAFLLAMIEYNRQELSDLAREQETSG